MLMSEDASKKSQRRYPSFYERFVPIAIVLLVIVIVAMLAFTLAIGTGLLVLG